MLGEAVVEVLGEALLEPVWSVADGVLLIEPVELLCGVVPVVLVLPTWFWSLGCVVVVVVVVWLPLGLV